MPTGTPTPPAGLFAGMLGYTPGDHLSNLVVDGTQWEVVVSAPTQLRTTGAATVTPQLLNWVIAQNLGFNIPANATISGVEAIINWLSQSSSTGKIQNCALFSGGSISGTGLLGTAKNPNTPVTTVSTDVVYGSSSDLWGNTNLQPSTLNSSNFGFGVQIAVDTIRDFINKFSVIVTFVWKGQTYQQMWRFNQPIAYRLVFPLANGANSNSPDGWVFLD